MITFAPNAAPHHSGHEKKQDIEVHLSNELGRPSCTFMTLTHMLTMQAFAVPSAHSHQAARLIKEVL
tara:strand:+ start:895 stop:1095 length:201 start_codon:yes stop_codon:yes gene_type:complete